MRDSGGVLGLVDIGREEGPVSALSTGLKALPKSCCDCGRANNADEVLFAGGLGGVLLAASAITVLISTLQKLLCVRARYWGTGACSLTSEPRELSIWVTG